MWEYYRVLEDKIDVWKMNALGDEGWELVGISNGYSHNVLYFKRRKK